MSNAKALRGRILRALLWKEWRESWWLLILTVVAPVGIWLASSLFEDPSVWPFMMFALVLLGGVLAARLFAGERARGTDAFQNERPVHPGLVWNAKLLLPGASLLLGLALSISIALNLGAMAISEHGIRWENDFAPPSLAILAFSAVTFCSVLLDRAVTALAAGWVLWMLGFMSSVLLLHWMDWSSAPWEGHAAGAVFLVLAIGFLLLSRWIFVRRSWGRAG